MTLDENQSPLLLRYYHRMVVLQILTTTMQACKLQYTFQCRSLCRSHRLYALYLWFSKTMFWMQTPEARPAKAKKALTATMMAEARPCVSGQELMPSEDLVIPLGYLMILFSTSPVLRSWLGLALPQQKSMTFDSLESPSTINLRRGWGWYLYVFRSLLLTPRQTERCHKQAVN